MMRAAMTTTLCLALLLTNGCHVSGDLRPVVRWSPEHRPKLSRAPHAGSYALYVAGTTTEAKRTPPGDPLLRCHLQRGDVIGFVREDGGMFAVAGIDRMPLNDAPHVWIMQAEPGQVDWGKSVVTGVVLFPIVLVVVAVLGLAGVERLP